MLVLFIIIGRKRGGLVTCQQIVFNGEARGYLTMVAECGFVILGASTTATTQSKTVKTTLTTTSDTSTNNDTKQISCDIK